MALVGCVGLEEYDDDDDDDGPDVESGVFDTHRYFPLDGAQRSWTFYAESEAFLLHAEMLTPFDREGSTRIATIEYFQEDPEELLYDIQWSSDATDGILIHGFDDARTGVHGTFSPPAVLATSEMSPGDTVTKEYEGFAITSTFVGVESCPNNWAAEAWNCLHFEVSTDWSVTPPFEGEWWLADDWGPSWFQPVDMSAPWVLTEATWSASD